MLFPPPPSQFLSIISTHDTVKRAAQSTPLFIVIHLYCCSLRAVYVQLKIIRYYVIVARYILCEHCPCTQRFDIRAKVFQSSVALTILKIRRFYQEWFFFQILVKQFKRLVYLLQNTIYVKTISLSALVIQHT